MSNPFFDHPILNSPYERPLRHWELDSAGQPTQQIIEHRRKAEFITPIPKPKKRKKSTQQDGFVFDEGKGLSTKAQQYDLTAIINEVRQNVDLWRALPNPSQWQVTPETARLLQHWRHHKFGSIRPFFCQVEATETAIWLTEVAPHTASGKRILELLVAANKDANPELMRFALKLASRRFRCGISAKGFHPALARHPPADPVKRVRLSHSAVGFAFAPFGLAVDRGLRPGLFVLDELGKPHLDVLLNECRFGGILCASCAGRNWDWVLAAGEIFIIASVYRIRKMVGAGRFELYQARITKPLKTEDV